MTDARRPYRPWSRLVCRWFHQSTFEEFVQVKGVVTTTTLVKRECGICGRDLLRKGSSHA